MNIQTLLVLLLPASMPLAPSPPKPDNAAPVAEVTVVATWTPWYYIGTFGNSRVEISFLQTYCSDGMLAGYSYYRTKTTGSTPKGWVRFNFDYLNCAGEHQAEGVSVNLAEVGIDADPGRWFLGYDVTTTYIPGSVQYDQY